MTLDEILIQGLTREWRRQTSRGLVSGKLITRSGDVSFSPSPCPSSDSMAHTTVDPVLPTPAPHGPRPDNSSVRVWTTVQHKFSPSSPGWTQVSPTGHGILSSP